MALLDVSLGALAVLLATSAGALTVLLLRKIDEARYCILLAFAAGVMAYSSIEMLTEAHGSSGDVSVLLGFALGVAGLMAVERLLPHVHRHLRQEDISDGKKKATLIAGTIALHNVPEGFAIATAFASSPALGWFVTTSIALQDVPEGALVSTPLAAYGISRRDSVLYGVFSGAIEAAAAIGGFLFLSAFSAFVPLALAFSAGAMAYVIFAELLPDAMENGKERAAAMSFLGGMAVAFVLASLLAA